MKIKFWGSRGSTPVPGKDTIIYGGNTTCVEIAHENGKRIIIDAGTGIRELANELESYNENVDIHLLITHIHWDHVLGFPFFYPIYKSSTRISVDGYRSCMKGLRYSFDNKMGDGFFPIRFEELKAKINFLDRLGKGKLDIEGIKIDSIPLIHPQGGLGFRFSQGKKKLVFITDNELDTKEKSFEDYIKFCKGADILIHDAHFKPDEILKHRGWGHSDYISTLELALLADVKKLILFHHAPERKDADLIKAVLHCQEIIMEKDASLEVEAAKEGSGFVL